LMPRRAHDRAMTRFASLACALVLASCSAQVQVDPDCADPGCRLYCEHGFVTGEDGCAVCECAPPPGGCEPVTCNLACEVGFQTGPDGCEICACIEPSSDEPSPVGCVEGGCPSDSFCDTSRGCAPSACACDLGSWACTDDCGGGVCVPVGGACAGENPAGCSSQGCPQGEVCDTNLGCLPSACDCDVKTGSWGCTADCGGGICVPDPAGCSEPYPGGCFETGCPLEQVCSMTSGVCVPSSCVCDASTGGWSCTDDCGGGLCVGP